MKNSKPGARIQVIDRAAALLEAISHYSMPVTLKALSADTNLPSYTRKTFSTLQSLEEEYLYSIEQGFAYDNEEAETGVGCIGVLIYGQLGEVIAGLSVSAPIVRRKDEWVHDLVATGKQLSARFGYVEKTHSGR